MAHLTPPLGNPWHSSKYKVGRVAHGGQGHGGSCDGWTEQVEHLAHKSLRQVKQEFALAWKVVHEDCIPLDKPQE